MSSKSRGAGTSKDVPPAKLVQTVLEATSCSEEEAKQMLLDCNNDCNEAVNRLLDGGAFAAVINKKQRRKQVRSVRCIRMHCLPRLRLGLSADGASMTRRPHSCFTLDRRRTRGRRRSRPRCLRSGDSLPPRRRRANEREE